jgi:hypothetical protein
MGEQQYWRKGGQSDLAAFLVDRGGLHGGDLVLAQALADNVEPTGQRRRAEGSVTLAGGGTTGGWWPSAIFRDWSARPGLWRGLRQWRQWFHWNDASAAFHSVGSVSYFQYEKR